MAWSGDEQLLRAEYETRIPMHERAARAFASAVAESVRTVGVEPLAVGHRIKAYGSFREKMRKKGYDAPLEQTTDIIGLRVVLLRSTEVAKAIEVLKIDFDVLKHETKGAANEETYRSDHLDMRIKDEWTMVPMFRRLGQVIFEVQVRTALAHAWAEIGHGLYKPRGELHAGLQKDFNDLAEALRGCDNTLDRLASQLD